MESKERSPFKEPNHHPQVIIILEYFHLTATARMGMLNISKMVSTVTAELLVTIRTICLHDIELVGFPPYRATASEQRIERR